MEEGDGGFSYKTEGQTFLGLSSIAACIATFLRTTDLQVSSVNLACVIRVKSLISLIISGCFVMRFAEGFFHGDADGKKNCSYSPEAAGDPFLACPPHSYESYLRSDRLLFVTKFDKKRNNVICPKQLCCADQHLPQSTQAQFPIDRSGIRLNSKLFAQTVVRRAVIMPRELVKRANSRYIFQEDEDRTRCKMQPAGRATVTGSTCT